MQKSIKSKAEQRFAATEKKTQQALQAKEKSHQNLMERMAKQRALRLAKEQTDKEAAEKEAAEKPVSKKTAQLPRYYFIAGSDPDNGLDLGAALAGPFGDLAVLIFNGRTDQLLEVLAKRLVEQFVGNPPVRRHHAVFVIYVERRVSGALAFGFLARHGSASI